MLISSNLVTPSFRALVPKKQYTGTILKLTKSDKEKIAELQKELVSFECDAYGSGKFVRSPNMLKPAEFDKYYSRTRGIEERIDYLRSQIEKIKRNRLKIQMEKETKTSGK